MKENIEVTDINGNKKKANVECKLFDEKSNKYYIVYSVNGEYFSAKYDNVIGYSNLDTILSEEEIVALEYLVNEMKVYNND